MLFILLFVPMVVVVVVLTAYTYIHTCNVHYDGHLTFFLFLLLFILLI